MERLKPHLWYWNTSKSTTPHRSTGSARAPAGLSSAQQGSLAGPGCVVRKGWRAHVSGGALAAAVPHGTGTDAIQHPGPTGTGAHSAPGTLAGGRGLAGAGRGLDTRPVSCRRARAAPARPACGARSCVNANERRARRGGGAIPLSPSPSERPGITGGRRKRRHGCSCPGCWDKSRSPPRRQNEIKSLYLRCFSLDDRKVVAGPWEPALPKRPTELAPPLAEVVAPTRPVGARGAGPGLMHYSWWGRRTGSLPGPAGLGRCLWRHCDECSGALKGAAAAPSRQRGGGSRGAAGASLRRLGRLPSGGTGGLPSFPPRRCQARECPAVPLRYGVAAGGGRTEEFLSGGSDLSGRIPDLVDPCGCDCRREGAPCRGSQ